MAGETSCFSWASSSSPTRATSSCAGWSTARPPSPSTTPRRSSSIEKGLGTFFEPGLQAALLDDAWLIDIANWLYVNTHFVITTTFLAWLYLFRNEHFPFVRNMFMVAMGLALIGYALFPTAPPRMLPGEGFTDTIATFTAVDQDSNAVSLLVNKYAAVPSMHIGFALMIAGTGWRSSPTAPGACSGRSIRCSSSPSWSSPRTTTGSTPPPAPLVAAAAALVAHRLLAPVRPAPGRSGAPGRPAEASA